MYNLIRGQVMRVTKLDSCGNKVLGPDSTVTTDGFVSIQMAAQTTAGSAITVTNANGKDCISFTPAPIFDSYIVTATFCGVEPQLVALTTGQPIVYAANGTTPVGFEETPDVDANNIAFALEVWSKVPAGCSGSSTQFGYFLLPYVKGGVLGDTTIQNDAVDFVLNGAQTADAQQWGVGPYNVVKNASNADAPLNVALATNAHRHLELTTTTPPTSASGSSALGTLATGATAGIPGSFTPANSYGPLNLAGMTGITASPGTNWTAGQYVSTRDGLKAYWNGTTWVLGAHP